MKSRRVRTPDSFEPTRFSKMRKPKPVTKIVFVPGGSGVNWKCCVCSAVLVPHTECVKIGKQLYCSLCIQLRNGNTMKGDSI